MKTNIIIVDDNADFCEAMRFLLAPEENLKIIVYQSAAEFLQEYCDDLSGFLLMDLFMPLIDGMMLLEELKKRPHNLYIIVISGHADEVTALKVKQLGADEFSPKPFDIEKLLEKIKQPFSCHRDTKKL